MRLAYTGVPLIMVPRIYADSLISDDDLHSLTYLDDLVAEIDPAHQLVYCGDEIVSFRAGGDVAGRIDSKNLIVWDNFTLMTIVRGACFLAMAASWHGAELAVESNRHD